MGGKAVAQGMDAAAFFDAGGMFCPAINALDAGDAHRYIFEFTENRKAFGRKHFQYSRTSSSALAERRV